MALMQKKIATDGKAPIVRTLVPVGTVRQVAGANVGSLAWQHIVKNASQTQRSPSQARRRLILDQNPQQTHTRKRKMEHGPDEFYDDEDADPVFLDQPSSSSKTPKTPKTNSRFDCSLMLLTRRFVQMQHGAKDGVVHLNEAANALGIQKRRLYDITNVLEGIDIVEKIGKNSIQWRQTRNDDNGTCREKENALRGELSQLDRKENELDSLGEIMAQAVLNAKSNPLDAQYAYMHYAEVRSSVTLCDEKTVLMIRSPTGSEVFVQSPNEDNTHTMSVKSRDDRPVEAYILPDDNAVRQSNLLPQPSIDANISGNAEDFFKRTPVKLINESNLQRSPLKRANTSLYSSPPKQFPPYTHYTNRGLDDVLWSPSKLLNPPSPVPSNNSNKENPVMASDMSKSGPTDTAELTSASIMSYT